MNKKMLGGIIVLIALVGIVGVFLLIGQNTDTEPKKVYKAPSEEVMQKVRDDLAAQKAQEAAKPQPPKENRETGHQHADGTWHEGAHDHPTYTPSPVQIPAYITDSDVLAAWKRLDYISKNRHQWGTFSPRALELMEELTPVPSLYDHTAGEDCGGEFIPILDELAKLRDPRSAELLLTYQMDSGVSGNTPHEALRAMGPAAVPALITRLDYPPGEDSLFDPLDLLPQIVTAHRSELGGIVQHIIIPKIEAIAAYEGSGERADVNKQFALNALEVLLQKTGNR